MLKESNELPEDLNELEEVMTHLLKNKISRDEALKAIMLIEDISIQEAEELIKSVEL